MWANRLWANRRTYNPISTENITLAICRELERQPMKALEPDLPDFPGSGLYAIYYLGSRERLYAPLAPRAIPVYVGSAPSHDGATGSAAKSENPLCLRIRRHARSLSEGGLTLGGFRVRMLLLADVYARLGENRMRLCYQPVWNAILTGFDGDEEDSSIRGSARTKWDTVHFNKSRTYGASAYNRDELIEQAKAHIAYQVADETRIPWRHGF